MTITTDPAAPAATDPRSLVPRELLMRLTNRIAQEEEVTHEYAERVAAAALAFLHACALAPGARLTPSMQVDVGWHSFILYTAEYAEFCERVAGRFIHHSPDDAPGAHTDVSGAVRVTVDVMRAAGLPVDDELWSGRPGDCSQCHQGCHDSP